MIGASPLGTTSLGESFGSIGNTVNTYGAPIGGYNEVGYNYLTSAFISAALSTYNGQTVFFAFFG
jgi:hypothetical protein